VKDLAQRLGRPCDLSLLDMHRLLKERGYGIDQGRLASYLQTSSNASSRAGSMR
jgi:hypothetical protein